MSKCPHHWTITSECPRCLRERLDRLRIVLRMVFYARFGVGQKVEDVLAHDVAELAYRALEDEERAESQREEKPT